MNKDNCRFPKGEEGKETLLRMNEMHNEGATWAISNLEFGRNLNILDVGCGGGKNISNLATKFNDSVIYGVDYSSTSVDVASEINSHLIEQKRVFIDEQSVSNLKFKDIFFDIVCAFETIYFWPDIKNDFLEIKRVLKDGGKFLIFVEGSTKEVLKEWSKEVHLKNQLTKDELINILKEVGYKNIQSFNMNKSEKLCIISQK
ncbi:putative methyl transferase [Campylobacter sputorum subsp. bubulus]|uniref:Putative methyl transferase n=1 Tax=Campylobacter sputorum subsp. sputorum TaxID=32024 RepID=A0A381DLI7_9BACT|nr:class I SAM-dependent methyltransferase [Campylobacter sputorum]ASM34779.1 SAM-dependent methyltransferase [Campylobacter sputorum aubsp. sputorum RM3237]KAB0581665.1 class I SAM-dependent methyltransferase [Campylobacter sputorum subsp. sputorum]QEL04972.1 SAM-dependent methyltransferase [Campylobacter sputorum subsp. sputorum]SUX10104.1 putative methyl transferase [Campylobacter sputorum subsp. bubulus]SUX11460.1 putative methyl transferase [Campylobacter sputorum subsp. sputorum]